MERIGESLAASPSAATVATMDAVRRLVRALRAATVESEAAQQVSAAQLFVLRLIGEHGVPTIGELSERTATVQSSVSEVVTRLVARGLVARVPSTSDRRRVALTLTAAGRKLVAAAPETVQERLIDAFMTLPGETQRVLAESLTAWVDAAGLSHVAATMFFEPGGDGSA